MQAFKPYNILAFLLGFSCFIVQLVLIREFMNLFAGNELVIGILLALWMLLTATGALAGRYFYVPSKSSVILFILLILIGILPLAGAMFSYWLQSLLYAPGEMISLQGILLISISGLGLFCLSSGMMFTMLASAYPVTEKGNSISRIYAIEALGGLAGGLIFNFILIYTFSSMRILSILMIINLIMGLAFAISQKKKAWIGIAASLALALIVLSTLYNPDRISAEIRFPGQEILLNEDTPFGKLQVYEQAGQINFYHNGVPSDAYNDVIEREEKVHYAMCLHDSPKDILILSGGLDGMIDEVLKYPVSTIDYVEPDPWTMNAAQQFYPYSWPEDVNIHQMDPIRFLRGSDKKYDVVLINLPPPETIGNNRFYSVGFYDQFRRHLKEGGILSIRLPAAGNYISHEKALLYSIVYNTVVRPFPNIRIIQGTHTYFLASKSPLDGSITTQISDKEIATEYVNKFYLDDAQMNARADLIMASIDRDSGINHDFRPMPAYLSVMRWLEMFHIPAWIVILIPVILMMIIIIRLKSVNLGLFTTGFSASAAEFLLLVAYQVAYGFVYRMAGLIIMIFMAGLALGAGYLYRIFPDTKRIFIIYQFLIGLAVLMLPVVMMIVVIPNTPAPPWLIICISTFGIAALTGMQYRLGTKLLQGNNTSIAASSYSADLAGSAFGMFFIAVFVYPLIGLIYTGLLLAGINFLVAAGMRLRDLGT